MAISSEERLKWWHEARFGMFIHWGLYAKLAGEWNGEKIPGIGEWIMRNAKIPIPEYEKLANDFNPVEFDADEWVGVAKQAGMKYLVITAKHHDGFCMFNSPSNPYNIVNCTPFKRDPMKELAEACRKQGIRMCFYYSQALDWHADGGAGHWDEVGEGKDWLSYARPAEDFQAYLDRVVKPNLKELLTNYGPIGLIWFDTPVAITPEQSASIRDYVHELQPECLVSGRIGHDVGDYGSLGDNEHPKGAVKGAWETPATLNDTWGYKTDDHNWKSLDFLLDLLVNCASKGVNYLLNVGPTAEGVIPQPSVDLLKQVGEWLTRNGESIYGSQASPLPIDPSWGRITQKGNTLYLMIKEWPADALRLYGITSPIKAARLLGVPDAEVTFNQDGDTLSLSLPAINPEEQIAVVAVEAEDVLTVDPILVQEGRLPIELPTAAAIIDGVMTANPAGVMQGWTSDGQKASWTFRVKTPGTYRVCAISKVHRGRKELYGEPRVVATVNGETLEGKVNLELLDMSEAVKVYQMLPTALGDVSFTQAGDYALELTASDFDLHQVSDDTSDKPRGFSLLTVKLALEGS